MELTYGVNLGVIKDVSWFFFVSLYINIYNIYSFLLVNHRKTYLSLRTHRFREFFIYNRCNIEISLKSRYNFLYKSLYDILYHAFSTWIYGLFFILKNFFVTLEIVGILPCFGARRDLSYGVAFNTLCNNNGFECRRSAISTETTVMEKNKHLCVLQSTLSCKHDCVQWDCVLNATR